MNAVVNGQSYPLDGDTMYDDYGPFVYWWAQEIPKCPHCSEPLTWANSDRKVNLEFRSTETFRLECEYCDWRSDWQAR